MNLNIKAIDIGCIILLVAAVAVGGFLIQNNFSQNFSQIKLGKEQLFEKKNRLKLETKNLAQLRSQFQNQEEELQRLNKRVPETSKIGDLLTELHTFVGQRNTTLIDFNHKPPQDFERYKRIPVQISVQGDFLNIYRLIHDLETLNRVFIFEQIVIKKEEENKNCQAILMASVFKQ
jgi:Tfp pilus assembly protein PilO